MMISLHTPTKMCALTGNLKFKLTSVAKGIEMNHLYPNTS